MNAYRITFADGNSLITSMNADLDGARQYYIGQSFQFGDTDEHPADKLVKAVSVDCMNLEVKEGR